MGFAARVGDTTTHGGTIVGPGNPQVLIGGMPAAVLGDNHVCPIPPNTGHITSSPFIKGSTKVLIGGKPALRSLMDTCVCGAAGVPNSAKVMIG